MLSSLHTIGAANTISRIIDVFNASQQRQIAVQLSMVLKAVVSQQLVPAKNGTLVPAFEIMVMTPAISNMIRDNKVHQIDGIIYTSAKEDMISMTTVSWGFTEKASSRRRPCFSTAPIRK